MCLQQPQAGEIRLGEAGGGAVNPEEQLLLRLLPPFPRRSTCLTAASLRFGVEEARLFAQS